MRHSIAKLNLRFLRNKTVQHICFIILALLFVKALQIGFIQLSVKPENILNELSNKWDAYYFIDIAKNGYPIGQVSGVYAFPALYPFLIRVTNTLSNNYFFSAAVVSNVFSFLTVIAFYFTARIYFRPKNSLYASLAFSFFPTFVTYGLVSYSESVFLFLSILSWYFWAKEKYFYSAVFTSFAVLAREVGILIPAIYIIFAIKRRIIFKNKALLWLILPFLTFGLMMCYLDILSGHTLSYLEAQSIWGMKIENPIAQLNWFFTGTFQGDPVMIVLVRYIYVLPFLSLAYPLWKINKEASLYSIIFLLFFLSLTGTSAMSSPRYMLSAWPIFLVFGKVKKEYMFPLLILFLILGFESTYMHLTSFWT